MSAGVFLARKKKKELIMSKKLISVGLLLALVWPVSARDLGDATGIPGKDLSSYQILGSPEQDIVIMPGFEQRYNYNHNGVGRDTPDTLAYDYAWGCLLYTSDAADE